MNKNSVMGRTNKFYQKFQKNVAITFQKTKFAESKSVFTGIPIRIKNKKVFKKIKKNSSNNWRKSRLLIFSLNLFS